jgi:soluble lytic murein transglycosylase
MTASAERAIGSAGLSPQAVVAAFNGVEPKSQRGKYTLARAYLALGQKDKARKLVVPLWRNARISRSMERAISKRFSTILTRADHKHRMDAALYREHTNTALRVAKRAGALNLAKARIGVIANSGNARQLLANVPKSQRSDAGYIFSKVQYLRRAKKYKQAARLVLSAPKDIKRVVNGDEWWIERRLVSRHLLDLGDARTAYAIAAGHAAQSRAKKAEAEFHAGWYALRYLDNPAGARPHFARIKQISDRPISSARADYWLGRTEEQAGNADKAKAHYSAASRFAGTFYGQLAARALGIAELDVTRPKASKPERERFENRELVKAIKRLEAVGFESHAKTIYRHLAETLDSPGELALLASRAEKRDNHTLALQIGKIAYGRGLPVENLAFPVGAIPASARVKGAGHALAYSIARQESTFNKAARSPANALGLLQLLPGTAKSMARKTGLGYSEKRLTTDAAYNASLGVAYLNQQIDTFEGSYILTFAGYNAGPSRARQWIEKYGDPRGKDTEWVVDWVERVPFTETRNYIQRVMENYQVYKARLGASPLQIEKDLRFGRTS